MSPTKTAPGFVHTAPGHGREDFEAWMDAAQSLEVRGIDSSIPFTVDGDGYFTDDAPGFEGKQVITHKGDKGDANEAVIKELIARGMLFSRAPPETSISPFVALEKTNHLPQYTAMVRLYGPRYRQRPEIRSVRVH